MSPELYFASCDQSLADGLVTLVAHGVNSKEFGPLYAVVIYRMTVKTITHVLLYRAKS